MQENVGLCCCRIRIFSPFTPVIADLKQDVNVLNPHVLNHEFIEILPLR